MEAVMLPRLNAQAVEEIGLRSVALDLVNQDGAGEVLHVEEVESGGDGHVGVAITKDTAHGQGIARVPVILTDGAPHAIEANLHLPLVAHFSPHQTNVAIVAHQTGIISYTGRNTASKEIIAGSNGLKSHTNEAHIDKGRLHLQSGSKNLNPEEKRSLAIFPHLHCIQLAAAR